MMVLLKYKHNLRFGDNYRSYGCMMLQLNSETTKWHLFYNCIAKVEQLIEVHHQYS